MQKTTKTINIIFHPAHNNITIANGVSGRDSQQASSGLIRTTGERKESRRGMRNSAPGKEAGCLEGTPGEAVLAKALKTSGKFVPCRKCERTWKSEGRAPKDENNEKAGHSQEGKAGSNRYFTYEEETERQQCQGANT